MNTASPASSKRPKTADAASAPPDSAPPGLPDLFSRLARQVSIWLAHPVAFAVALVGVLAWAVTGPVFHYSNTWQLVINTGTTILTFLSVFLIQNTQNRDARAVHMKLNELLRSTTHARNDLIDLENLPEEVLERYSREFEAMHHRYAQALSLRKASHE